MCSGADTTGDMAAIAKIDSISSLSTSRSLNKHNTLMLRIVSLIPILCLTALPFTLNAESPDNLLTNSDFISDSGVIPGWQFSTWNLAQNIEMAKQVDWGVVDETDGTHSLSFKTKAPIKNNLWWQQRLNISGSGRYELSVSVKLVRKDEAVAHYGVGIYFLDGEGKWLAFERLESSGTPSGGWEEISGTILAPEEAASLTVRLGADFDGEVEFLVKNPVLKAQ